MATALVAEAPHEWLGIATFVFFVAHQALNRRWWARLGRNFRKPGRALSALLNLALAGCMIGLMASSLVLSQHAFSWLPAIDGAAWARVVHLLCSYWAFVLAFAHAGLKAHTLLAGHRRNAGVKRLARTALAVAALYGASCIVSLNIVDYLLLKQQFAFVDFSTPLYVTGARFACAGAFIAAIAHYASALARAIARHKKDQQIHLPRGNSPERRPRESASRTKG